MKEIRVLGVHVENRVAEAGEIQGILTKYGCNIKTRIGLHEASEDSCGTNGLIILELGGNSADWDALEKGLNSCKGTKVQRMSF